MDPDKRRKIVAVTVFLPLFIAGIGLILGLSGWWITAAVIIIPASILAAWFTPSFLQSQQPNQNQPSWFSRLLGRAKKDPLSAFVFSIALLVIVYGVFSYLQGPEEIYTAKDFIGGTLTLGKSDFSTIEIYFAETPKEGDIVDVFVGPYKARTKIGGCYYTQNTSCYLGEWWYIDDPSNPIGANSGGVAEVWYVSQTMVSPLTIKKGLLQSPTIWIGDNRITSLLRSDVLTPKPIEGEKTISCSGCKIKEVRVY